MSFTYLEMNVLWSFNVPSWSTDASHVLVTATNDAGCAPFHGSYTIRQYFNVDGQFQKWDIVVNEGIDESPNWVWMRHELENSEGNRRFFLDQETHPYQGCIDLFTDEDFWGANGTLDDEEPKIIIESGSGLDATINNFTVSVPKTLLITVDVTNSFNFWEEFTNSTYYNDILDFGPSYDEIPIGDGDIMYYGYDNAPYRFHIPLPEHFLQSGSEASLIGPDHTLEVSCLNHGQDQPNHSSRRFS